MTEMGEKENWMDKGKQGRKHDEKWGGRGKNIKKEVSLSDRELSE